MIDPVMGGNATPVSWRGTMIIQVLHCPNCQGTDIVRHGKTRQDKQRYCCREKRCAGRTVVLEYAYAGQSPEVKQQIVAMAMNASGIRDTARVLHISPNTPTVSLGVTYAVVDTYGCGNGRIGPTHCAVIDAGLGGRCRPRRACRTPPAVARSARSALAAGSEPGSPADLGGFHQSGTTPPSTTRPCGDASRARSAPGTHPCPPRLCLV